MYQKCSKLILPLLLLAAISAFAEVDPDPDSPLPILKSISAISDAKPTKRVLESKPEVFRPGTETRAVAILSNVELINGEGANAFRVFLIQKSGRVFELQSEDLRQIGKRDYSLTFRLFDPNGFRGQPVGDGESVVYVTWRGLATNPLKILVGRSGGAIDIPAFLKRPEIVKAEPTADLVGYRWSGDRTRFLEQATFGPTTETDNRIRRIGLRTWLAEQFEMPYPTLPYPEIPLMPTAPPSSCSQTTAPSCYRERYTQMPLQQWFFKEAFYGDAQLRHRMAWALGQIWVTSGLTIQQSSHMIAYHKVLSKNAFGNYRDLMYEMTLNPAMGEYLDMIRSTKNNPNENYAREILQLFSIGLFRLNPDGTPIRDAQNNTLPTYDQATVNNFAKVFTGWSHCNSAQCPNAIPGTLNFKDPMALNPAGHDTTEKVLLDYPNVVNRTVAACADCSTPEQIAAYANASLNQALDNIFYHPNTAPYVSRVLIQHFVTSDPSPAYVERVANVFANNGQNVRGDLKALLRAILLDPEARGNLKTAPRYGKLREPVQLVTNLGRIFPARSWNGESITDGGLNSQMTKLAQSPFYSPSVFNYFQPEYVVPGTTLNAPEFGLLNSSLATNRTNFLYVLVFDGYAPNATDSLRGISLELSEAIGAADADPTGNGLLDHLNNKMLHGAMSAEHRASLLGAISVIPPTSSALRVKQAIYLVSASSQYQIQR